MGYAYLVISLVLGAALLVVVLRKGWVEPFWATVLTITLLPAIWGTLIGIGAAPCRPDACVPKAEQHRQLFAAPALVLIVVGLALLGFGVKWALEACVVAAGILTAFALTKTDSTPVWFLGLLVAIEVAYAAVPVLQRRAAAARLPGSDAAGL